MKYRIIKPQKFDAFMNMALEEAIMKGISEGTSPPTIRFFEWEPKAVSIGYFQSLENEVNEKKCEEEGIDIVRRITGGGAVFHDKEITYSVIAPESEFSKDIVKSYEEICGYIIRGLNNLGISAVFKPINDVLVENKKISGSAQTRKFGVLLQHGTLIYEVSQPELFSILKGKDKKTKFTKSNKKVVTSVLEHSKASLEEVQTVLESAFSYGREVFIDTYSEKELQDAKILSEKKYSTNAWNKLR